MYVYVLDGKSAKHKQVVKFKVIVQSQQLEDI